MVSLALTVFLAIRLCERVPLPYFSLPAIYYILQFQRKRGRPYFSLRPMIVIFQTRHWGIYSIGHLLEIVCLAVPFMFGQTQGGTLGKSRIAPFRSNKDWGLDTSMRRTCQIGCKMYGLSAGRLVWLEVSDFSCGFLSGLCLECLLVPEGLFGGLACRFCGQWWVDRVWPGDAWGKYISWKVDIVD